MRLIPFVFLVLFGYSCASEDSSPSPTSTPKLVVGIVVDQMRYDYLTRFESKYSDNGFKRILKTGFSCQEHHFSYMPTYTGPGHASIFSGSTPSTNGIIANDWYDKGLGELIYCVQDTNVKSVGGDFIDENRSPKNLLVSTLADQVKKEWGGKSIGVSIKDRGAVLPAGKSADGAYWFKGGRAGLFISSTYYFDQLPSWVHEFNAQDLPSEYLSRKWETLLPISEYVESNSDYNEYENSIDPNNPPVFPYDLPEIVKTEGYSLIKTTPFGNDLLLDFTIAAIEGEDLGQDDKVDWLSISYSSTDYIGHEYGPNSVEIEDTYLRLDQNIGELLTYLDENVGEGNYLLFLTADHGVAEIPQELIDRGDNAGYYNNAEIKKEVEAVLQVKYGNHQRNEDDFILSYSNYQFFLNHQLIGELGISSDSICETIAEVALKLSGVKTVYLRSELESGQTKSEEAHKVQNGWNAKRSGDVMLVMEYGWVSDYYKSIGGTTHGSLWAYDTHVPLLFYGYGIKSGSSNIGTQVEDIFPTVAKLINTTVPKTVTGEAIKEVVK